MMPCKVCGLEARIGYDTCSVECAVEAWAATWAVTPEQKRYASWCLKRRRAEARGEPFTESAPLDQGEREWRLLLATHPNLKAHWMETQ